MSSQKGDKYYRKAKEEGFRARSAYKLFQIDAKFNIFRVNGRFPLHTLDMGASPGSWLEVIIKKYEQLPDKQRPNKFKVIAIDLNSIKAFENAPYINFYRIDIFKPRIEEVLDEIKYLDLIISDLAPKTAGDSRDTAIQESMVERAFEFCNMYLKRGGNFVTKIFQSPDTRLILKNHEKEFEHLQLTKPSASRQQSREMYLVGKNFLRKDTYNKR